MGKVLTPDEVRNCTRPDAESFRLVQEELRKSFDESDAIIGGIIFGSVLTSQRNYRSDIDVLVMHHGQKLRQAMEVFQNLHFLAAKNRVPLQLIPLDGDIVQIGAHGIDTFLFDHLRASVKRGGVIKENILSRFCFRRLYAGQNIREELLRYLVFKLQQLGKGLARLGSMSFQDHCQFLQNALDTPVHIARKLLAWQEIEIQDDSKETIRHVYPAYSRDPEKTLFQTVCDTDQWYSMELDGHFANPNQIAYEAVIEKLTTAAWQSFQFTREVILRFFL